MRVIVTCGPSYEPIDYVRRLTNFSTGELGLLLASQLAQAGHTVLCLKGTGATAQLATPRVEVLPFSTNDDLLWKFHTYAGKADAILHTAALCDYRVQSIENTSGEPIDSMGKIPSRAGGLVLKLEPTTKVLPQLRAFYPKARIVGWKYELEGGRDSALAKAERQIAECSTDACVVNGSGWGEGFGFVQKDEGVVTINDKVSLAEFLTTWLTRGVSVPVAAAPPELPPTA